MSKYDPLWNYIKENGTDKFKLTFAEKGNIVGMPTIPFLNLRKNRSYTTIR